MSGVASQARPRYQLAFLKAEMARQTELRTPRHPARILTMRIAMVPTAYERTIRGAKLLASGEGASPGVGIGVVVDNSDEAERRARAR